MDPCGTPLDNVVQSLLDDEIFTVASFHADKRIKVHKQRL